MGQAADKKRILVVDDEAKIRTIIRHVLEKEGFEVYTAENGDEGVKAAVAAPPDLILLDVTMPVKGGFDACRELKRVERTRAVPVVFLTAKSGEESWTKALHRGAAAYLEKPFRNDALVALVHEVLDLAKAATAPAPKPTAPARSRTPRSTR